MNNETDRINEYLKNNTKEDFLTLLDTLLQDNPLLMQLMFSSWKLRAMNLIDDLELEKIHKGLDKNRDRLKQDFIKEMKSRR